MNPKCRPTIILRRNGGSCMFVHPPVYRPRPTGIYNMAKWDWITDYREYFPIIDIENKVSHGGICMLMALCIGYISSTVYNYEPRVEPSESARGIRDI